MYNIIESQLTAKNIRDMQNVFIINSVYNMYTSEMTNGQPKENSLSSKILQGIEIDDYINKNLTQFVIESDLFIIIDTSIQDVYYTYLKNNICIDIKKDCINIITYDKCVEDEFDYFLRKRFSNYGNEYPIKHRISFSLIGGLIDINEFHDFSEKINYSGYNIAEIMPDIISTFITNDTNKRKELDDFLLLTHDISLEKYFPYSKVCSTFESLHNVLNKSKNNNLSMDKK